MNFLRSAVYNVFYLAWTLPLMALFAPALLLPQAMLWPCIRFWIGGLVVGARLICGIRFEVRGEVPRSPVLIVSRHESALDIYLLVTILGRPAFVMKRSLLFLPLFGVYLQRAGNVAIDRARGTQAIKRMLRGAGRVIAQGRPVVVFPQGTRVVHGVRGIYQPGAAMLYSQLGVPAVPVRVNTGAFWPRARFRKRPGVAVVEFLAPIAPGELPAREFVKEVERRIETSQ